MGSSLSQTMRQVGGALGVAVLGSVLAGAYTSGLRLPAALPEPARQAARDSVAAAQAVAAKLGVPDVYQTARLSYVHAMDIVLLICAVASVLGAVLSARFIPVAPGSGASGVPDQADATQPPSSRIAGPGGPESSHEPARTA
jgi:hypothetical protein